MPWKTTKLKFFGVAVRRRSLYGLALFFAIAAVPTLSWALLVQSVNAPSMQKLIYELVAIAVMVLTFRAWWMIIRHHPTLYREEARFIWPGAAVLLVLAVAVGCAVAQSIKPGRLSNAAPLALGGIFLAFLVFRCFQLSRYPRRADIVRGESGSRRALRSGRPGATPSPLPEPADGLDAESMEDDSAATNPDA